MKKTKTNLGVSIIILISLLFLGLFSVYFFFQSPKDEIKSSIAKGEKFLANADLDLETFGKEHYCLDEKNQMQKSCLYKRVDYSIDLVFIDRELVKPINPELEKRTTEADKFLRSFLPEWENQSIDFSYLDSGFKEGDQAFDLYCIIALIYEDRPMFSKLNSTLKENGWLNEETADKFRRITDESWCISLLAKFKTNQSIIDNLIELKQKQFEDFQKFEESKSSKELNDDKKFMTASHILMVLDEMKGNGYDTTKHKILVSRLQEVMMEFTNKYPNNIEIQHTSLYFLSKTKYHDANALKQIAERIVKLQDKDGGWHYDTEGYKDKYRVLLTSRAILALNQYMLNYSN